MTRALTIATIAAAWMICGVAAAGFLNADFREGFCDLNHFPKQATSTQALSLISGLVGGPISLIASAGVTGFFYSGWTLTRQPTGDCR